MSTMTTLRRCLKYLDSRHVRYAHTTHSAAYTAREVAAREFLTPHQIAKTVVLMGDGYLFAVIPGDRHVSIEKMRLVTGVENARIASEGELFLLFPNAELGAMPPLGPLFDIPVYLDREFEEEEFIVFNAGTHRDVIHMRMRDFISLVKPVIGEFSRTEIPAMAMA